MDAHRHTARLARPGRAEGCPPTARAIAMAASLVLVVAACTADRGQDAEPSPAATSTWTSTSTSTSVVRTAEPCDVERRVTGLGNNDALGDGPVRIAGGRRNDPATFGIFRDAEAPDRQLIKLYWLRDVSFTSTVRVAGARLGDRAPVAFLHADLAESKTLEPSTFVNGQGFAIGADVLVIAGPGCYGIDLSADGVTRRVVIRAA